jgi:lysophospholipase L1-like esterase
MAKRKGAGGTGKAKDGRAPARASARRAFDAGARLADEVRRRRRSALAAAARRPKLGLLIAEGDSWFDYPFHDVLERLEALGYEVESVAHMGDTLEDMAHDAGQVERLARAFEKVRERGRTPKAILLSGGGNDIAGEAFAMLLNHARSGLPALNATVAAGVIGERLRTAMASLVGVVTRLSESHFGARAPVVIHGYDYPVPDGRGYLGGAWILPGPWLEPGFRRKGHHARGGQGRLPALEANALVLRDLIDRYDTMLAGLVSDLASSGLSHVRFVDLRGTLSAALPSAYKADWGNELHPTRAGFARVAARIAAAID